MKRGWAGTWDWPLVGIVVLILALLLFLTMSQAPNLAARDATHLTIWPN